MRFFTIALKDLKIRARDKKGFVMMLAMPIILTAILGAAFSDAFSGRVPAITAGIVVDTEDVMTKQLTEEVLQGEVLSDQLILEDFASTSALKTAVQQQTVDVGIFLPAGWGDSLINGDGIDAVILADPEKETQAAILRSIMTSFAERVTAVSTATRVVSTEVQTAVPDAEFDVASLASRLAAIAGSTTDTVITEEEGETTVSGLQYYAAAMGAMFVLFNVMIGARSIMEERSTETLARLMSSPVSHYSIIAGKFLGTLYAALLQFVVFVLATHYFFGVDWGNNLLQTMVIGVAYAVAVSGLSMTLAAFLTDEKTVDMVGGIGVQIFALLGGSMIPLAAFPEFLQRLANIAPNKWALSSLVDVMEGTTWNALILPIAVLMLVGIASLTTGALKLRIR